MGARDQDPSLDKRNPEDIDAGVKTVEAESQSLQVNKTSEVRIPIGEGEQFEDINKQDDSRRTCSRTSSESSQDSDTPLSSSSSSTDSLNSQDHGSNTSDTSPSSSSTDSFGMKPYSSSISGTSSSSPSLSSTDSFGMEAYYPSTLNTFSSSSSSSSSTYCLEINPHSSKTSAIPSCKSSSSTSTNSHEAKPSCPNTSELEVGMQPNSSSNSNSSSAPNTTSIHVSDNGKSYTAQEPTKPRSWLDPFNSLAPRTRQTVRTAAIAIVSALALVAIFHLAKLAEHPVDDNSINGGHEKLQISEDVRNNEGFLKTNTGKAYRPPEHTGDNWRSGNEFGEANLSPEGKNPVAPIQDMLARAGHNAKIHPILGVPVASSFLDRDIERLNRLDRARARPANSTEIEMTLSLVRSEVESDRKLLKNKDLRLWTTGDAPLRVLLVTTWRSGSTFLGQVLANHPAVFHHYEPLSAKGIKQIRSGRDAFQAQQLLHRLLDCRYSGLNDYLNYTRSHPQDMMGHNKPIWEACKNGPNTNACYDAGFLSKACEMFPIQLVKTVRLRLNLTQLFLNDEKMNVKVVFLVRDPRATMSSRYSSVSWCTDKPDCSSPEILCSDLQDDLKVSTALEQLYPNRFIQIKYEDLAMKPHEEIQHLMNFLGMEYSPEIARFVGEHTQTNQENPWSTKRKSSDRVNMWKKQLPLEEVHAIQNACEPVLKSLGYELVGQ